MENRPIRYVYMATPEESEKTLHKVVDLLVFWAKEEKRKEVEKMNMNKEKLVKENAELKQQLEERRNQIRIPTDCLKFEDPMEDFRFNNQSGKGKQKSLSWLQQQIYSHSGTCILRFVLK